MLQKRKLKHLFSPVKYYVLFNMEKVVYYSFLLTLEINITSLDVQTFQIEYTATPPNCKHIYYFSTFMIQDVGRFS